MVRAATALILLLALTVGVTFVRPTAAQDSTTDDRVAVLETAVAALQTQVAILEGDQSSPGTKPAQAVVAAPTQSPSQPVSTAAGTRENPIPLGERANVGTWEVRVLSAEQVDDAVLIEENMFNEPAEPGKSFTLINVEITNTGAESNTLSSALSFAALGPDNVAATFSNARCGVTPDELDRNAEIFPGGTVTGNICLQTETASVSQTVLYIEELFVYDRETRVWFSLSDS